MRDGADEANSDDSEVNRREENAGAGEHKHGEDSLSSAAEKNGS